MDAHFLSLCAALELARTGDDQPRFVCDADTPPPSGGGAANTAVGALTAWEAPDDAPAFPFGLAPPSDAGSSGDAPVSDDEMMSVISSIPSPIATTDVATATDDFREVCVRGPRVWNTGESNLNPLINHPLCDLVGYPCFTADFVRAAREKRFLYPFFLALRQALARSRKAFVELGGLKAVADAFAQRANADSSATFAELIASECGLPSL